MKTQTITTQQFLRGGAVHNPSISHHGYRAHMNGRSIVVVDAGGTVVENVRYGGTIDNRTVTASIDDVGFIGGWQYPHKAQPFSKLADSINRGRLYSAMALLPKRSSQ